MFCLFCFTQIYLKLRKYYNFGRKNSRRAWHVIIPAREVNHRIFGSTFLKEPRFSEDVNWFRILSVFRSPFSILLSSFLFHFLRSQGTMSLITGYFNTISPVRVRPRSSALFFAGDHVRSASAHPRNA